MRSELKAKILFAIVVGLVSTSFGFVQAKVNGVTWNYGVSGDVAVLSVFTNYYYNGRSVHRAIDAMFLSEIPDDIVIPSRLGGYPVGIIRNGSFSHCTESRSVYIPSSVTNIEVGAFSGCSNIRSITIPQCLCDGRLPSMFGSYKSITNINFSGTIKEIGNDAFSGCTGLVGITIPNSVTNIGNNAFSGCSNLTSVTIGNSKVSIGDGAFYDCCNLASDDGFVIVRNVLYRYCGGDENIGIPDGVIRIGTSAFAGCTQLVGITIPNSVTSIGDKSFSGCAGLTGITIPNSVTNIDAAAFAGCSALSNATLPWDILLKFETISSDGWSLLSMDADGTEEYQSVPINNSAATSMSLTLTGPYDFVFSWKVSSERGYDYLSWDLDSTEKARISGTSSTWQKVFVSVPTGKHTIKWTYSKDSSSASGFDCGWVRIPRRRRVAEMFPDSYSTLRAVTLTGTTTTIPDYAFDCCASLSAIDIPPMVTNVGASAFSGCSTLTSLMIPNSVTSIGESAFYNCSGLTSVTIPYSVTGIGEGAFSGCSGLTNVTFYGDAPAGILGSSVLSCATSVRYRKKYAESYEPFVPVSKFGGYVSTAEDIIDLVGCSVSYDDDSPWVDDYDVSHDGEGSMRSGRIENADSTWIETTVNGAGQLSFWWKASSEGYDGDVFDYAYLSVDGVPQGSLGEYKLQGVAIGGKTGWTNVVFDVMEAGPHTIRWTYCKDEVDESDVGSDCVWLDEVSFDPLVSLSFTLDGGEGTVPDSMAKFAQTKIVLPAADRFSKAKHRFGGWSDGVNTYGAGAEYVVPDSNVVFSAAWAANTLVAPVVTSADVADGGTLTTAFATIRITAEAGASIHYTMDGSEPTAESALYTEPFTTDGQMVMIRAVAVKDDYFDSPVTEFSFTRKPFSVAECLNIEGRKVSTDGGDTAWFRVLDAAAHDGEAALRSGVIDDSGTSSVEMTVRGAGEISFWWKVSSEISRNRKYDYVSFLIDGEEQSWLGGEVEWTNEVFAVSGEGAHTLKWVYQKNDNGLTDGEDCAWLDDVTWTSVGVDSYFVEFDACGGEATLASLVLEGGSALGILPDAERSCYEFVGWYTAASGGTKVSADTTVTADVTYYAHWQINSYTVTFDVNGGSLGVASPTTRNVAHGAAVGELPDVTRTGYSFVGWYTEAEGGTKISADTTVTADVTYYAHWRYVEVPDDSTIVFNTEETYETEADGSLLFNLTELVGSTSTPKITVKGLPTGLKFDAKTWAITGQETKPGVYKVTVSATNATVKKPVTATFEIFVPNLTSERLPGLEPDRDAYGVVRCGVAFDPDFVDCSPEAGWSVKGSGLPAGLKYDTKTGKIVGIPTKAGTFTVTFTASKKGEKSQTATITLETEALPDWATGAFAGFVKDGDDYGSATMTVTANGKVRGKIALVGTNWTFSAASYAVVDDGAFVVEAEAKAGKATRPLSVEVREHAGAEPLANALAAGSFGGGTATLLRNIWKDKATAAEAKAVIVGWEGVYTLSFMDGGYLSLTVGKNGDVKASGKLSDGTSVSATAPLMHNDCWDGFFTVFCVAPSAYKGGFVLLPVGFGAERGRLGEIGAAAAMARIRNPQATGEYGEGFGRQLYFTGAYYDKAKNLNEYYEALRFATDVPELAYGFKRTYLDGNNRKATVQESMVAGAADTLWQEGCMAGVGDKGALVVAKATKPVQDKETKEWSYGGANDGALSLSFTQATGIFKGSYTFWFDYMSAYDETTDKATMAHTSKKVSFEGVVVQGDESLRGFYLWDATGSYEDPKTGKEKTYKYKESFPVSLLSE